MNTLAKLYPAHAIELQKRMQAALARDNLDGLVIHSGQRN